MESLFKHLSLKDSDDVFNEQDNRGPLGAQELKLISWIQQLIKEQKYDDIPLLFTTDKNASSNVEMLPKISMYLYGDVCQKHMTEDTYESSVRLYKCAEGLLRRIAKYAPVVEFLFKMIGLLGTDSPECLFVSALSVLDIALLRLPDDNGELTVNVFEDCLDEITLRRDVYAPMPTYLLLGNYTDIEVRLQTDDELKEFITFHDRVHTFYSALLEEICSHPRLETEIFRSCTINKRNMLCCFLIKMLQKPLALFDIRCSAAKKKSRCPLFFAISLTQAVTKCIGNPFFLLNFVEQKYKWDLRSYLTTKEDDDANYFLKELPLRTESLAIYFYMVIVEGIDATKVPKIYHPLYVCEVGLYLVHYLLTNVPVPGLQDKGLRLATKLLTNLRHIHLPSIDLDIWIYKVFLNDLRKLALDPVTANILVQTLTALKQYIICSVDDDKYSILKTLMTTVNHSSLCGSLINMYKDLVAKALKASSSTPLPNIYSGQQFRTIFLENICKLKQGVKTDPAQNSDQIEAALETILLFATIDTENRTGFWCFISEINSQFISPLRKAINFYESRFKNEITNALRGRDMSGQKRGTKAHQKDIYMRLGTLKSYLDDITRLRNIMPAVCDSLTNSPIDNENNIVNSNSVNAK